MGTNDEATNVDGNKKIATRRVVALYSAVAVALLAFCLAALGYAVHEGFDITIENLGPTEFNTLSAGVSVISTVLFGWAMSLAFKQFFLSWSMRRGIDLPVSVLGTGPANVVGSFWMARTMKFTVPLVIVTTLFLFADLAHTFGDLGLDFVNIRVSGPDDTVLNLGKRNLARLIQTAGDPSETFPNFIYYAQAFDSEGNWNTTALPYVRMLTRMIDDFLLATDLIARDGSPFISEGKVVRRDVLDEQLGSGYNFDQLYDASNDPKNLFERYFYGENNTFLTEIPLEIPLHCGEPEMVEVDQLALSNCEDDYFNTTGPNGFNSTALVPNCTFAAERSSGIFGEPPKTASILESANRAMLENGTAFLKNGTDRLPNIFNATPDMRALARDRDSWKSGRTVPGITGLRIGTHDIDFGTVVLAGGIQSTGVTIPNTTHFSFATQAETFYLLVAEVAGTCPPRPSGFPVTDTICYATVEIYCSPSFPEDSGYSGKCYGPETISLLFGEDPACFAFALNIHWGKGFEFDAELAAVVAGMYGRIKPDPADLYFSRMASLAGLFITASLDVRASTADIIRPKINSVFIGVRLLPFFLVAMLLLIVVYFSHFYPELELPIPHEAEQLLELGSEEHQVIAKRKIDKGPSSKMVLTLRDGDKIALKLSDNHACLISQPTDSQSTGPGEDGSQDEAEKETEQYEV